MGLLTKEQYEKIAGSIKYDGKAFIDGKFTESVSGMTAATENPATGKKLCEVVSCNKEDVDIAVKAARKAFEDKRWAGLKPSERKKILLKFAELILKNQDELAVIESLDSGKPVYDTAQADVPETAACVQWHAEAADKLEDQVAATGPDQVGACCARAGRRGRRGAAVEFSDPDGRLEICAHSCFGKQRDIKTVEADLPVSSAHGRARQGGRNTGRRF